MEGKSPLPKTGWKKSTSIFLVPPWKPSILGFLANCCFFFGSVWSRWKWNSNGCFPGRQLLPWIPLAFSQYPELHDYHFRYPGNSPCSQFPSAWTWTPPQNQPHKKHQEIAQQNTPVLSTSTWLLFFERRQSRGEDGLKPLPDSMTRFEAWSQISGVGGCRQLTSCYSSKVCKKCPLQNQGKVWYTFTVHHPQVGLTSCFYFFLCHFFLKFFKLWYFRRTVI